MQHGHPYRGEAETRAHGPVHQAPPGFLEETMARIRQLPPPRYRWPLRVWYAILYRLRWGWAAVRADRLKMPATLLRAIPVAWHPWVEQAIDALLAALGPEERVLLHAHCRAHFGAPWLTRLPSFGGLVHHAPPEPGQDWTPTLLTLFEQDVVPFLRARLDLSPPPAVRLPLPPEHGAALMQRLRRRAQRLRLPATEQHRLEAALRHCLLTAP